MQPAAACLLKLSKHITLLTCLLILSRPSGRADIDQIWIFGAASLASLLHLTGRALRMRSARQIPN
jgi:hypothetical protein